MEFHPTNTGGMFLTEERRLMTAGLPLDEAISICASMRREGRALQDFVEKEERCCHGRICLTREWPGGAE